MNSVRPGVAEGVSPFELIIPVLDSRRFRCHEILKINRLPSGPDTLRPTEIRNSAYSRNTGAGKDERLLRSTEIIGQRHVPNIGALNDDATAPRALDREGCQELLD